MIEQIELFPNLPVKRIKQKLEYGKFTDKFKAKLTTDDCYTPEKIYEVVKNWTVKEYGLENFEIVRPFWPGGDFETFDYSKNCVVIDNPPFSLYEKILKFYTENNIKFMLFGPALTMFKKYDCCYIITNETITYANGAKVNTSFVTNLDKNYRIRTCPTLKMAIREAEQGLKIKYVKTRKLVYSDDVVTSAILGKTSRVEFNVKKSDCVFITCVNNERLYGGGYLLSDRAAADRAAAGNVIIRSLGPVELKLKKELNKIL